jgi:hypothetical protein
MTQNQENRTKHWYLNGFKQLFQIIQWDRHNDVLFCVQERKIQVFPITIVRCFHYTLWKISCVKNFFE